MKTETIRHPIAILALVALCSFAIPATAQDLSPTALPAEEGTLMPAPEPMQLTRGLGVSASCSWTCDMQEDDPAWEPSCHGPCSATVFGGTSPFTWEWYNSNGAACLMDGSTGSTSEAQCGCKSGETIQVSVTDSQGQQGSDSVACDV